jgi:hypothetical protein
VKVFSRFDFSESGFKDKVKGREERDPHKNTQEDRETEREVEGIGVEG